jgi:hypothetical protein
MLDGLKIRLVPPTITLWSLLDGTPENVGTGAVADEAEGEEEGVAPVAAAWNAAKSLPGLTAKTIPDLQ